VLASGESLKYRVVTLDLPRRYSEPHDIASDPSGVGWAAERAGALIRFDPKTYDFAEVRVPAGPAPADRQRLGNPQINAQGILWTADGPNNRWLSYDTKAYNAANPQAPFPRLSVDAEGPWRRGRQFLCAASGRHRVGHRHGQGSAHAESRDG